MGETHVEGALGKMPDALKGRARTVELSDGSTVVVEKWSWMKFQDAVLMVADLKKALPLAELSVRESDRARVRELPAADILAIAATATELNMTPATIKNVQTLLSQGTRLLEGVAKSDQ